MGTSFRHDLQERSPRPLVAVGQAGRGEWPEAWEGTPLGPVWSWPQPLRQAALLIAPIPTPAVIWWGDDLAQLYNAACLPLYGGWLPGGLGRSARILPPAGWSALLPRLERVLATGAAVECEERVALPGDGGGAATRHFAASLSPVRDACGRVAGVLGLLQDVTARVVAERGQALLAELAALPRDRTPAQVCQAAADILAEHAGDTSFALIYLVDAAWGRAHLVGIAGARGEPAPAEIDLTADGADGTWPIGRALEAGRIATVAGRAAIVPLAVDDGARPLGVAILGVAAAPDDDERAFLARGAVAVAAAVAAARALDEERRQGAGLVALEAAKVGFFNEVHHQLVATLTSLVNPLQALHADMRGTAAERREPLEIAHRACLQLLKQTNALLQFARIEGGRLAADRRPTDLARFTADLARLFGPIADEAGVRLRVDCPPLPGPVALDRAMWEKIVLNLLSNAFKNTRRGEVAVILRPAAGGAGATLEVRDTGSGIPPAATAALFEPYRRVRIGGGRAADGLGLGLTLVRELVRLLDGTVTVESAVGRGSSFVVAIPGGPAPQASPGEADAAIRATPLAPTPYVAEARRWLAEAGPGPSAGAGAAPGGERVLVAAASRELRRYLRWLLAGHWPVETVGDADAALAVVRADPPALLLAERSLPSVDGVDFLRVLRGHPSTAALPVLLLTGGARERVAAGAPGGAADEYLAMPFSADELLARVRAHLDLARARREARELREEFIATVAHDLRTPLTSLQVGLGLLESGEESLPAGVRELLGMMRRNAQRLAIHVGDLITANQLGAGMLAIEREPIDLAEVVRGAIEAVRPLLWEKGQLITVALPGRLPVIGDAHRLEQVLVNLLANAYRYTPPGARVTVAGRAGATTIDLGVCDDGPGIPEAELERIFERHRRLDPGHGGSGLGLSTARRLIELHGGRIWAERPRGGGACFRISLPRRDGIMGQGGRNGDAPADRR